MTPLYVSWLIALLSGTTLLHAFAQNSHDIKCTMGPEVKQQISPELEVKLLLNLMRRLVEKQWETKKPPIPSGYRVRLIFDLQPNGQISHIEQREKSLSKAVDLSLFRALAAISPLKRYKNESVRRFEMVFIQAAFPELSFNYLAN